MLLAVVIFIKPAKCQVKITGPACVIANNIYSYQFIGDSSHSAKITSVCIEGGKIYEQNDQCVHADTSNGDTEYMQFVYVVWNDSASAGTIHAEDSSGIITSGVSIISTLNGGIPDSTTSIQIIPPNTQPANIICSAAAGGNCNPAYNYWWEQSSDDQHWTLVPGAVSSNLQFSSSLNQTTYFRRGVRETTTNETTFSLPAIVFIDPAAVQ
jgi:hypothetical protein